MIPFDDELRHREAADDFGKAEGDELTTCADPKGDDLDNKGGQTVGGSTVDTNEPKICVTVPPIHKQVIAESSRAATSPASTPRPCSPARPWNTPCRVDPPTPPTRHIR